MTGELWKMDCSQCAIFRTTPSEAEAHTLCEDHKRDANHNSAIVTKIRAKAYGSV